MSDPHSPAARAPRIVVVGAGFGGMAAVLALKGAGAAVTLVDRTNHHLFQPLLYQVATAALSPSDIAVATRALLRKRDDVTVLMAEVTGIDTDRRCVRLIDHADLPYDYLILATGAAYSFFGHDEWGAHAKVLKSLDDGLGIRTRLLAAFERAEQSDDPDEVRRLLTFVVIGGGPTGVELTGAIAELARMTIARDFKRIDPASARVVLCEAADRLLGGFPPDDGRYAATTLADLLNVEVRLDTPVSAIDADGVTLGDERIETANVFWCAGTRARPAAGWLAAAAARNGAVEVTGDCSVPGQPHVFAIGDVASHMGTDGRPLPGLAPVAKQQGAYVGRVIAARIAGRPAPPPFRYRDYGALAVIGRSHAVFAHGRMTLHGRIGWLIWSLVHLMLLVDFRSRAAVYVNWTWAFFTWGRGARLLTGTATPRQKAGVAEQAEAT